MLKLLVQAVIAVFFCIPIYGQQFSPEGTYDVLICRESCEIADTSSALVSGQLVIGSPILVIPDDVAKFLNRRSSFLLGEEDANACFVFDKHMDETGIYTGIIKVALTHWQPFIDAGNDAKRADISIALYGSPDATSIFNLSVEDARLTGWGEDVYGEFRLVDSAQNGIGENMTIDVDVQRNEGGYLVARRVGQAEFELCWEAAREQ